MRLPHSTRKPLVLPEAELRALLRKRHKADKTDYFANDPNPEISQLGKLALRRPHINTLFALGDLCLEQALTSDNRLLVFYVGKALIAYQRVLQLTVDNDDRDLAYDMLESVIHWTKHIAEQYPTPRNIAVALWALAEEDATTSLDETAVEELFDQYLQRIPKPGADIAYSDEITQYAEDMDRTEVDIRRLNLLHESATGIMDPLDEEPEDETNTQYDTEFNALLSETRIEQNTALMEQSSLFERDETQHQVRGSSFLQTNPEASPEDTDEFKKGDVINNQYRVVDIRRGGMGVVYLCYDDAKREPVAIKTFQSKFLTNPIAVTRFNNEAAIWMQLDKHRHVVQARLVQHIKDRPHIILEHISGEELHGPDLRSWIDHNRLDLRQSLIFGLHIALGMQHATQRVPNLVHRDLKPGNILVTHDGIAKITDFGLVHSVDPRSIPDDAQTDQPTYGRRPNMQLTRAGKVVGTAPYMSPEQCTASPVDVRSDIYAFGCVMYEMLTSKPVFTARKLPEWINAHLNQTPAFPPEHAEHIPESLQILVLKCLEKQPEDRPNAWSDLVEELSSLYEEITGEHAVLEVTGPALEARELMDKGYSLTELGYLDEALKAYDSAINLQPDYAWAWARKGRTLRLMNRLEEALACYDTALKFQPNYAFAWNGKGIVLERMNRLEDALAAYETAAQINPSDVWHWCNLADVLQAMERHREAIPMLEKALQQDPSHPNSWAKLAQVHRILKNYPDAIQCYERALELDNEYAWAHNGYGLTLKAVGRLEDALMSFKRASRHQPSEVWHWYNVTETLIDLKQYDDAIFPAQKATMVDPNHAYSWAKLGQVLRYVKRYEESLEAYNRSLALQPNNGWVINGKAIVLERMNRLEEALACYKEATQYDDSDSWHANFNLGNILVLLQRYSEALPLLRLAVQTQPTHARSWGRLGNVLRHLKHYEEAIEALEEAIRLDPGYAWAWNEIGNTYDAMNQETEALEAYKQASFVAPTDALYLYHQADLLVQMRRHEEALPLLDQALNLNQRNARVWAKHGQVLRRLGRFNEALESYTRSIEIEPEYAWAWNGQGLTLSALGQHEDALQCFQNAATLDHKDVWHWYNQGDELVILGRFDEALNVLDQALKLNPRHADSWAKRGQALRRKGQLSEALSAYDQALNINPRYDWAWNGRGLILQMLNRREEALASFQRAAQEAPENILAYINQVDVLLDMKQKDEALRVIDVAIALEPDNATLWARRGQVLRRMERHSAAVDSYQHALSLNDTYAWAWNGQGLAFKAQGLWEEALSCYELAVHYAGNDVWFWHNYGEALMELGVDDDALAAFNKALSIKPDHRPSREKRDILLSRLSDDDLDSDDDFSDDDTLEDRQD